MRSMKLFSKNLLVSTDFNVAQSAFSKILSKKGCLFSQKFLVELIAFPIFCSNVFLWYKDVLEWCHHQLLYGQI
jgi:hypothetical protein